MYQVRQESSLLKKNFLCLCQIKTILSEDLETSEALKAKHSLKGKNLSLFSPIVARSRRLNQKALASCQTRIVLIWERAKHFCDYESGINITFRRDKIKPHQKIALLRIFFNIFLINYLSVIWIKSQSFMEKCVGR